MLILSCFFLGSEVALLSASQFNIELISQKDSWTGRALDQFLQQPENYFATTRIGHTVANVVFATLITLLLTGPIRNFFSWASVGQPPAAVVLAIVIIIAAAAIILLGKLLPNILFRLQADRWINVIIIPQQLCYYLFRPVISVINKAGPAISKRFEPELAAYGDQLDKNSIAFLFQQMRNTDTEELDDEDSEILHNVLKLSEVQVKESMIPRTDIIAVEKTAGIDETLKLFITSGYSQLLVYEETIDDIIGVIFAYDLFSEPDHLSEIIRPVKLVPQTQHSKDLLAEFRKSNITVAVVIDEYGGTAGMVTIEDLLEEVVGDIQDEYDTEEHFVKQINDSTYVLSAGVEIEDLLKEYPEIDLPERTGEYETVAGYVINSMGRIPKVNEELLIDENKVIISKATANRIETLKLVCLDG